MFNKKDQKIVLMEKMKAGDSSVKVSVLGNAVL